MLHSFLQESAHVDAVQLCINPTTGSGNSAIYELIAHVNLQCWDNSGEPLFLDGADALLCTLQQSKERDLWFFYF